MPHTSLTKKLASNSRKRFKMSGVTCKKGYHFFLYLRGTLACHTCEQGFMLVVKRDQAESEGLRLENM
jgi:hypothetical protein